MLGRRFFAAISSLCLSAIACHSVHAETGALAIPLTDDNGEQRLVAFYVRSQALVIGIDQYEPGNAGWSRLREAVNDAVAVSNELERHGFGVTVLVDRDVTLASGRKVKGQRIDLATLEDAFRTFIREHGYAEESRLVIWYSGHGHTVAKNGYLVPVDAPNPGQPSGSGDRTRAEHEFDAKALNMLRFSEYMQRIRARHVLAIFDSCFAGEGIPRSTGPVDGSRLTVQATRPVRHFITSGDALQEVADDGKFRDLFIRALQGFHEPDGQDADQNKDGVVTGTELGRYITRKVAYYSPNLRQTPQSSKMRDGRFNLGEFVFRVLRPTTIALPSSNTNTTQGSVRATPPSAGLASTTPPGPMNVPSSMSLDDSAFVMDLQTELRRLGCYRGEIDGLWGAKSRGAFSAYLRSAKLDNVSAPRVEHLNDAKRRSSAVCPADCETGEDPFDGRCEPDIQFIFPPQPKSPKVIRQSPTRTQSRLPQKQEQNPPKYSGTLPQCGNYIHFIQPGAECRKTDGRICSVVLSGRRYETRDCR